MENPLYKSKSHFFKSNFGKISIKNKIMAIIIYLFLGNIHLSCMKFDFQIPTLKIAYYAAHVG